MKLFGVFSTDTIILLYFKDIRRSYTLGPILGAEITYCCYPRHRLIQS